MVRRHIGFRVTGGTTYRGLAPIRETFENHSVGMTTCMMRVFAYMPILRYTTTP
jgi:hypothetical protein